LDLFPLFEDGSSFSALASFSAFDLPLLASLSLALYTLAMWFFSVLAWVLLFNAFALPDFAPNNDGIDSDMLISIGGISAGASVVTGGASVVVVATAAEQKASEASVCSPWEMLTSYSAVKQNS